jgi:hypothetical protein
MFAALGIFKFFSFGPSGFKLVVVCDSVCYGVFSNFRVNNGLLIVFLIATADAFLLVNLLFRLLFAVILV